MLHLQVWILPDIYKYHIKIMIMIIIDVILIVVHWEDRTRLVKFLHSFRMPTVSHVRFFFSLPWFLFSLALPALWLSRLHFGRVQAYFILFCVLYCHDLRKSKTCGSLMWGKAKSDEMCPLEALQHSENTCHTPADRRLSHSLANTEPLVFENGGKITGRTCEFVGSFPTSHA